MSNSSVKLCKSTGWVSRIVLGPWAIHLAANVVPHLTNFITVKTVSHLFLGLSKHLPCGHNIGNRRPKIYPENQSVFLLGKVKAWVGFAALIFHMAHGLQQLLPECECSLFQTVDCPQELEDHVGWVKLLETLRYFHVEALVVLEDAIQEGSFYIQDLAVPIEDEHQN